MSDCSRDYVAFLEGCLTFLFFCICFLTLMLVGRVPKREHNHNLGLSSKYIPRSADMNYLPIQRCVGVNSIPPNQFSSLVSSLFLEEETADVLLEVGDGETRCQFYAHHLILKKCAPHLANMCEGCDKSEPLHLPDIEPDIFRELLRYVYGGKVKEALWMNHHRDFIDAADKFGVVSLKLEAETLFVRDTTITINNVVDVLAYADSKNCALMQESAIAFIMKNRSVLSSDSFKRIPMSEGVMREIFNVGYSMAHSSLSIKELRKRLTEKGMEIDGSREVLLARLEGNMK